MTVSITLPTPISQELMSELQTKITKEFNLGEGVIFEIEYNTSLVLGYQITVNNIVYDHSFGSFINKNLSIIQSKLQN